MGSFGFLLFKMKSLKSQSLKARMPMDLPPYIKSVFIMCSVLAFGM